ncbi:MAG: hypothetical protein QM627_13245 [Luteolibacter sp.]
MLWNARSQLPLTAGIPLSLLFALAANCAFLLGPAAELYIRALFKQGSPIGRGRLLIFTAGLLVSLGVILLASLPPLITDH